VLSHAVIRANRASVWLNHGTAATDVAESGASVHPAVQAWIVQKNGGPTAGVGPSASASGPGYRMSLTGVSAL
jgi:hypothetical protein